MDPAYLDRQLVHSVKVKLKSGPDADWQDKTVDRGRVPCLVDQSSGKRLVSAGQGATLSYDYAITIGSSVALTVGTTLEDARDQDGSLIFVRAKIGQLRVYRKPRTGGTWSYLAMAATME